MRTRAAKHMLACLMLRSFFQRRTAEGVSSALYGGFSNSGSPAPRPQRQGQAPGCNGERDGDDGDSVGGGAVGGDSGSDSIGRVGVDGDVGAEGVGGGVEAAAASGTLA